MTKMRNDVGVSNSTNKRDVSYRSNPRSATLRTNTLQLVNFKHPHILHKLLQFVSIPKKEQVNLYVMHSIILNLLREREKVYSP